MPLSVLDSASPQSQTHWHGFTLLEALVAMALLGILVGLAAPTLSGLQARQQLQGQGEAFLNSLVLARSEALRRQQRVSLCAQGLEAQCDTLGRWHQGWLVFADANHNGLRDSGEVLIEARPAVPLAMQVVVSNTVKTYFSYNAEGRSASANGAFMAGTWRFCRAGSNQGWQVVVNALGRPRIEAYEVQLCS
ncbi:GspH/FimT family pseudopilin [Limnohabitans sp. Rim8]|uniref:GspH/FimT family pseudopilin n=1 Tax=Limnohabitans sp. Rim8 TaxID=1100718 RepID=UPI0026242F5D|nr:GspH/FimT family pseudopilin [Limnohabitans sp. Rim8]